MGDDIARQRQLDTSSLRIGTARRYGGDAVHHEVVSPIPHSAPGRPPGSTDHSARPRRKKTSFSLTEPVSAGAASPRTPAENERLYGSATSSAHLPYPHTSSSTAMSSTPQLDPQHRPRSRSVGDAGDGATASHQRPYTAEPLTPGGTRRDPSRPWRKKTGVTNTAAVPQPAAPARADHAGDQASHGGGAGGGGGRGGGDGAADLLAASMFTMQVADLAQEATDVYGGAGAGGGSTAIATAAGGGGGGAGAGVPDVVTRQPVRPAASGERRPSTGPREHTLAQTDI